MRWIGLTGKLAAGKDYLYSQLWHHEPKLERVSFADTLRMEIQETLGLTYKIEKPYSELERRLQQWWGTDFRRAQDPDYWVKRAIERAHQLAENGLVPVFTDVRFPNEADAVRDNGGIIVRVWAPDEVREERNGGPLPDHASETAMDEYEADLTVDSTANDDVYEFDVRAVLNAVYGKPDRSPVVF